MFNSHKQLQHYVTTSTMQDGNTALSYLESAVHTSIESIYNENSNQHNNVDTVLKELQDNVYITDELTTTISSIQNDRAVKLRNIELLKKGISTLRLQLDERDRTIDKFKQVILASQISDKDIEIARLTSEVKNLERKIDLMNVSMKALICQRTELNNKLAEIHIATKEDRENTELIIGSFIQISQNTTEMLTAVAKVAIVKPVIFLIVNPILYLLKG